MKKHLAIFVIAISLIACNPPKPDQATETPQEDKIAIVVLEDRSKSFAKYPQLTDVDGSTESNENRKYSDFGSIYEYIKANGGSFFYGEVNHHSDDAFVSYVSETPPEIPIFDVSKINPLKIREAKSKFRSDSIKAMRAKAKYTARSYIHFVRFLANFRSRLDTRTYSEQTNIYTALKRADNILASNKSTKKFVILYSDGIDDTYSEARESFLIRPDITVILVNPSGTLPNIKVANMLTFATFQEAVQYVLPQE